MCFFPLPFSLPLDLFHLSVRRILIRQTLPQNHIFNPLLPPTPKMPRPPRRGESLLSINGSPLAPEDSSSEDEDEDDTELPDPRAYEAKLAKSQLGKSTSKPSSKGKGKRAPSLMIRQSLARVPAREEEEEDGTRSITLSDGRVISYNPFMVDPARMEDEMRESGLKEQDVELVSKQIRAEALKALMERMGSWKM
jgi:NACalpha-BTF3-like transcription factor